MRARSPVALSTVALFVAACGGPLPADEYCERTVDAYCGYYLRCGRMAASSSDDCANTFLETCNAVYEPHYAALATQGSLELSRQGVRACADHLETVACEAQLSDLQGGCADMWVGLEPEGASCGLGIESLVCDEATTCVLGLDLCGTCEATAATGASCADLHCTDTDACVDDVCVTRRLPGESCDDDHPCVLGASCDGTCVGPDYVAVGDDCDLEHRCPTGAACIGGACVQSALLGEACGAERACASGWCDDGTCAAFGDDGADCDQGWQCLAGTCDDGRCGALPGECF